jgi:hypothetical protein
MSSRLWRASAPPQKQKKNWFLLQKKPPGFLLLKQKFSLFGLAINGTGPATRPHSSLTQDTAFFLLARGDCAWLG